MTQPQDSELERGTAGVPTPEVSEVSVDKPSSEASSESAYEKAKRELRAEFQAELRAAQSTKDKQFKNVQTELETLKSYLDAAGGDVKKATREYQLDQLLSGESAGRTPAPEPTPRLSEFEQATAELLRESGIANDDPEVAELAKKPYRSKAAWFRELTRLADQRAQVASPQPTGAPVNDSRGRTTAAVDRDAQLSKLYADLEPLLSSPVKNDSRIRELKERIAKFG